MNTYFLRGLAMACAALFVGTGGLAGQETAPPPESSRAAVEAPNRLAMPGPQLEQRYPRYVIQRQDVLLLSFPLSPEMNQTVTVQPDGYINLQSAGSVHVQGMTVPDVAAAVKHAYAGVLNNPIVTVDLQDFQKPFFTVTGQVGKPGQYELRSDITVAEAIAVAGGMLATAKTQQIFLFHRSTNDWLKVEKINLRDILNGKKVNEDAFIKPGDMVFVPESAITKFRKYVPYSANAGSYLSETP